MFLLRMGLLFLMLVRALALIPRLRQKFSGDNASIEVAGVATPFQYRVLRNGKYKSVTSVQLALETPDRVRFRIKRENGFDRFAKQLGVAHEWQTGDREFDASAYILSDDAVLLSALSRNEALRAAVGDLLNQKLVYEPARLVLRCSHGTLWIDVQHSAERAERDIDDRLIDVRSGHAASKRSARRHRHAGHRGSHSLRLATNDADQPAAAGGGRCDLAGVRARNLARRESR